MLINERGELVDINTLILTKKAVHLGKNQFFSIPPSGKTVELWQRLKDGRMIRLRYWHRKSVLAFFKYEEQKEPNR